MEHPRTLLRSFNFLNPFRKRYRPAFDQAYSAFKKGERKLNALGREGQTLLHLAIIEEKEQQIDELIQLGASLDAKNRWGMTPHELSSLLSRKKLKTESKEPLRIFRNRDQKLHSISVQEFEERLKIEYIDSLEFENIDDLAWVVKQCRKRLHKHQFDQMNQWVLAMHQKAIGQIRRDLYYIRWINARLGYGVFAAKDLPNFTYIGEYTGVIKRRQLRKNRFNDYIFGYVVGPKDTPFIIDAEEKGNFSRFVNHSDTPNLTSRWVITGGVTRIILFANQFIRKDSQLTYDYGEYYWKNRRTPDLLT